MHVHRMPVDLNISNLYAAEAARKAAEAKQAADVRRKLLRASAGIGDDSLSFDDVAVGQREGGGSDQDREEGDQGYFASVLAQSKKPSKANDAQPAAPLSIWA